MTRDPIETLRAYQEWRIASDLHDQLPAYVVTAAIVETIAEVERSRAELLRMKNATLHARTEIERLEKIARAAEELIKQRGRHNTQIAYTNLESALSCKT